MRNYIWKNYKELNIEKEPNRGNNCIHASASPFETFAEKVNWLDIDITEDQFCKVLLEQGITKENIKEKLNDPKITLANLKWFLGIFCKFGLRLDNLPVVVPQLQKEVRIRVVSV